MPTVLCVSAHPEDLADGRVIARGATADNVDLDDPHNARLLEEGRLTITRSPQAPAPGRTIDEILGDVGDDPDKAHAALDAENAAVKPRSTLIDRLNAVITANTENDEGASQ